MLEWCFWLSKIVTNYFSPMRKFQLFLVKWEFSWIIFGQKKLFSTFCIIWPSEIHSNEFCQVRSPQNQISFGVMCVWKYSHLHMYNFMLQTFIYQDKAYIFFLLFVLVLIILVVLQPIIGPWLPSMLILCYCLPISNPKELFCILTHVSSAGSWSSLMVLPNICPLITFFWYLVITHSCQLPCPFKLLYFYKFY